MHFSKHAAERQAKAGAFRVGVTMHLAKYRKGNGNIFLTHANTGILKAYNSFASFIHAQRKGDAAFFCKTQRVRKKIEEQLPDFTLITIKRLYGAGDIQLKFQRFKLFL